MTVQRFPILEGRLSRQLNAVGQTAGLYYPCCVTLADDREIDCVYLADAKRWIREWGVWPSQDPGKQSIGLESVVSLRDSPSRLPKRFAEELYAAGESGMGYTIFTIVYADGTHQACSNGNAIDFVSHPQSNPDLCPEDMKRSQSHCHLNRLGEYHQHKR